MKYVVVIEKTPDNFSAYVPDLPGCVVTGNTREETELLMREAIIFHIEGMREDGMPIPEPQTSTSLADVPIS
jgi:predicted RNase H-like HicB family nuclease